MDSLHEKSIAYFAFIALVFFVPASTDLGLRIAQFSSYMGAVVALSPILLASGAQLYMMREVFNDSFQHGMDYDWWLAVLFLGPVGVLLYLYVRDSEG